jgi:hypothetical protein
MYGMWLFMRHKRCPKSSPSAYNLTDGIFYVKTHVDATGDIMINCDRGTEFSIYPKYHFLKSSSIFSQQKISYLVFNFKVEWSKLW